MDTFNPQRVLFISDGPYKLGNRGFVPPRKVFDARATILLRFAGGSPGDMRDPGVGFCPPPTSSFCKGQLICQVHFWGGGTWTPSS